MCAHRVTVILGLTMIAAAAPGCMADADGTGSTSLGEAESVHCQPCGYNGMDGEAFDAVPQDMSRATLAAAGLWTAAGVGPLSLCLPASIHGNECRIRPEWRIWTEQVRRRAVTFRFLVKIIAPPGFSVIAADREYPGEFGLVEPALTQTWTPDHQEIITGGLGALFNHASVREFYVCLKTKQFTFCHDEFRYVESVFYGNVFPHGRSRTMSGGPDAEDPLVNHRTGGTGTPLHFDILHEWGDRACDVIGAGAHRYATACENIWANPVTVLTSFPPGDTYYGVPTPQVPPSPPSSDDPTDERIDSIIP